jgi:hypothetical protein
MLNDSHQDVSGMMVHENQKSDDWWDRFKKWEEEWKEKRKEEQLKDARKLREAEEDYERSLHNLNPLSSRPAPKKILATQSREPGFMRMPLESPHHFPLFLPARVKKIVQNNQDEAIIFFHMDEKGKKTEILEPTAFMTKRLVEHLVNERMLFFIQPCDKGSFLIRVAGDKEVPPILEVSQYAKDAILIKVLEKSLPWSLGYQFNVPEILKQIVGRFEKEIEDQKEAE